jgi:single-strand DNA-binding protein
MNGLNRAYFIGNLGRDPETRTTRNDSIVVSLTLATPHVRKDGEGWVDTPDWHRLTAFGKTAEMLLRNAHKGDTMAVECVVRPNRWTDKEGQPRYDVNLYVERVLWISRKRTAGAAPTVNVMLPVAAEADAEAEAETEAAEAAPESETAEVEVPF